MSERRKYVEENKISTNYTTLFLLPMLGYYKVFYPKDFISAYIIDSKPPKLVLSFENSDDITLQRCLQTLQSNKNFENIDFDDDNKEIILIFNIPKDQLINYNLFIIGRYSKFSNDYKELLLDVHGRMTGSGKSLRMIDALHPDNHAKKFRADRLGVGINDLPNGEVMSIPDMSKEEYRKTSELTKVEQSK